MQYEISLWSPCVRHVITIIFILDPKCSITPASTKKINSIPSRTKTTTTTHQQDSTCLPLIIKDLLLKDSTVLNSLYSCQLKCLQYETTATASAEQVTEVSSRAHEAHFRWQRLTKLAVPVWHHGRSGGERRGTDPLANSATAWAVAGLRTTSFGEFYWPGFISFSCKKSGGPHDRQVDNSKLTAQHRCISAPLLSLIFKATSSIEWSFRQTLPGDTTAYQMGCAYRDACFNRQQKHCCQQFRAMSFLKIKLSPSCVQRSAAEISNSRAQGKA